MNFLKNPCLLLLLLAAPAVFAQKSDAWRTQFPEAEAVYTNLLCQVNISVDKDDQISASSEHSEDLMYLTPNAVKMMSRGHIYHSSFNVLKDWNAYTQLPENKKLKIANTNTSSSRQDYIFYDDTKLTSFDYAGAVSGATRHLEYQLQHSDAHLLTPYYFERYFPVINGELRVTFPDKIKLKYLIKGLNSQNVVFSETKKRDKTTYSFKVTNLKNTAGYPDAPDNSYYATHVIFYIDKIETHGEMKNFLSTPADLFKYNYAFIKNINSTTSSELKSLTDSITTSKKTDLEKAAAIYRWVQTHIKYVAFEDGLEGFIPREATLVCSRRFGDCKDMASILTAMLRHAGVPAYLPGSVRATCRTRTPNTAADCRQPYDLHHKIGATTIFSLMAPTTDVCLGCLLTAYKAKRPWWPSAKRSFKILNVPVMEKSRNAFTDTTLLEFNGNELKGKLKINMSGYWASSLYSATNYRTAKETEEYFKNRFARGNNKIRFLNWQFRITPDHNKAVVTADIELPDYAKRLGQRYLPEPEFV
jgi:hypothetical protein